MMEDKIKNIIMTVLSEFGLSAQKIILFGSRARGDHSQKSDWDILIILDKELTQEAVRLISRKIRENLAMALIPCDVLVRTPAQVEKFKQYVHSVTKNALKEGKEL